MTVSRNVLSALAAAAAVGKVSADFGPAFSTGPTSSDTYIIESWATLNLPAVPTDNSGDLSLWVGMGTSNGDLIQSIAENYNTDSWSVYAYTLMETSSTTQEPIQADGSTATAGTAVTFHYAYDSSTGNYTQNVIVGGSVVSTLSTSDGKAEGWGSAVECAASDCGTVGAHTWTNVSITLSGADADYINTLSLGTDVDATMTTSDGGITWEVGTISIPGYSFTTAEVTSSTTTSSSSSAASSSVSTTSSYGASGASSSGTATTGSNSGSSAGSTGSQSSGYPSSGSTTTGSDGAQASGSSTGSYSGFGGSSTSGSDGAQSSGTSTGSYGGYGGSSTSGSDGAQSSGTSTGSYGGFGGSSTSGSDGAQASGFSSGSSTWGSAGAQSSGTSGSSGFGGFGGSSAQPSAGASTSYDTDAFASWKRSRISRHKSN